MTVLVTGARGFVGRQLVPSLAAGGFTGIATGRIAPDDLPHGWTGVSRHDGLSKPHDAAGPIEAVMHLEVKQHVPRPTPADIAEFEAVNVGGTRDWLVWATRSNVRRFVHLSTIKAVATGRGPTDEDAPADPSSPYGRTKAQAEQEVRAWAAADPMRTAVILRPAPVYGPGNEANLAAFVRQIIAGKPCLIGRGETRKSIVSRTNLCAAVAFSLEHLGPGCHVFNVSDPSTPSLAELAAMIAGVAGAPTPKRIPAIVAAVAAPLGDAIESITGRDFPLTSARLRAIQETTIFPCDRLVAAGFRHPQSTSEGIAEMVAWTKANAG